MGSPVVFPARFADAITHTSTRRVWGPRAFANRMAIWQYGNMARVKTTLSLDEELMRHVRVRAARTGRTQSDILEEALREGLGVIHHIRVKNQADEEEILALASEAVHEARRENAR